VGAVALVELGLEGAVRPAQPADFVTARLAGCLELTDLRGQPTGFLAQLQHL
jgi:hypothetical protein